MLKRVSAVEAPEAESKANLKRDGSGDCWSLGSLSAHKWPKNRQNYGGLRLFLLLKGNWELGGPVLFQIHFNLVAYRPSVVKRER